MERGLGFRGSDDGPVHLVASGPKQHVVRPQTYLTGGFLLVVAFYHLASLVYYYNQSSRKSSYKDGNS